ncbi:nitric oxide associated protein 1 [Tieghemiomyces parasiticus]|uniref:Nitric oxide associated protein 1 n=1 Tax=Tieghemiomyces parasiticus TaxID=78921 RepID=A0A9W7ZX33_9FUNG|nr:nitric oxide associated protein 1 [Tieghemiomyces parasiticus]
MYALTPVFRRLAPRATVALRVRSASRSLLPCTGRLPLFTAQPQCSARSAFSTETPAVDIPASTNPAEPRPLTEDQPVEYAQPDTRNCPGCGAAFQFNDVYKPGYLPLIKADKSIAPAAYIESRKLRSNENVLSDEQFRRRVEALDPELRRHFGVDTPAPTKTTSSAPTDSTTAAINTEESNGADPNVRRVVCKRCHEMNHHHRIAPNWHRDVADDPEVLEFMKSKPSALVLHVLDVYDLQGSLLKGLSNFIGHQHRVILVVNKVDLLPKDVHLPRVATYVQRMMKDSGVLNIVAMHVVSARKVHGVRELCADLMALRRRFTQSPPDIYMVGRANVGKSELINAMLRISYGGTQYKVTTFPIPGTTCDVVEIPLQRFRKALVPYTPGEAQRAGGEVIDPGTLYDTPGVFNNYSLAKYLKPDELKLTWPKPHLSVSTYGLKCGQSLCIGGLGRIDLQEGGDAATGRIMVSVFSNLPVHITQTKKANAMFNRLAAGELVPDLHPPGRTMTPARAAVLPRLKFVSSHTLANENATMACADVYFMGVGWVAIAGRFKHAVIQVHSLGGRGAGIRPPLMPFEYQYRLSKFRSGVRKQR